MTEDQREQWRKALAAKAAAQRRHRPAARGIRNVNGAGMVRILPPKSERPRTRQGRHSQPKG